LLCFLFILPTFSSTFFIVLMSEILLMGIFALCFNLLLGYGGLLSLGQGAFFGVGAYVSGLMIKNITESMYLAIIVAILFSFFVSWVIGYLSLRLKKIGFAFLTLAFSQMIYTIIYKWKSVTGGDDGLIGIPKPILKLAFGITLDLSVSINYYFFVVILFFVSFLILKRITDSSFGLTLRAIGDSDLRAAFVGINVKRYQLFAFMIAGAFSGLVGAVFSIFTGMASPDLAHFTKSTEPMIMTLLGGTGVFVGPLVGAIVFILLKYLITYFTPYWMFYLGAILVFLVLFFPDGIAGFIKDKIIDRFWRE